MRFLASAILTGALFFVSAPQTFPQNGNADLVIVNANVRTMVARNARAEAVAVSGNKIIAVGSNAEVRKLIGPSTKTIDAKWRLVLPGFNDAHVHFAAIGNSFSTINLRDAKSPEEVRERLAFYAKFLPKGRWILGGGWDNSKWQPDTLPSRDLIDAVTLNNPVFIYHADGRSALANTFALNLAGIDKRVRPVFETHIDRHENGEPTGVLRDGAMRIISSIIPQSHTKNWPDIIETASNYAASLGVTSVQDMHSDDLADVYRELERQGRLKTRVYDCLVLSDWAKLAIRKEPRLADSKVRTGCVKSFSDGDEESLPRLKQEISAADKAGFQVMIHAIGAKPNELVLNIFEQVGKENGQRDRRFRIEHAHNFRREDLARFGKLQIIPSMQPYLFFDGVSSGSEVFRSLLDSDAPLAFGSDAAMTDFNPLLGIYAAVASNGFNGGKNLSVEDAVRAYTAGAAFAEFQEKVKGTIEAGKLADFVILSDDIFTLDPVKIRDVKVLATIVDGKVVYSMK